MTCRAVTTGERVYAFCPEDEVPAADRVRAVMRGRFLDELSGSAMNADLSVATEIAGLSPRTAVGGIAGLVGNPLRLFPGLAGGAVPLNMSVSAHRYLTRRFVVDLNVPGFPDSFQSFDLGDVMMHRQAVVLRGRAVRSGAAGRLPVGGAGVRVAGIWSVFPAADVDPLTVVEPPFVVSLQPGLYRDRFPGTDVLRQRELNLAAGQEKALLRPAMAGDTRLAIADRLNLNSGHVLAIEAAHPDLAEYIMVASIDPASTPDQPARVTLSHPVAHDHAEGVEAVRATPQPAGANNHLTRDGIPGDRSVFLNALTDLAGARVVEIAGSGDPEYQSIALYETLSDAEGYFRLPPISRVAELQLHAERADLPQPVDLRVSPNYDLAEDRADLVFA